MVDLSEAASPRGTVAGVPVSIPLYLSHVPNKVEQTVRYYGYYSNVTRGKRKKDDADDVIACILEPELTDKAFRRNRERLIQKIYEVDPLVCPRCAGPMRVIAFIEQVDVIGKILEHLGCGVHGANRS